VKPLRVAVIQTDPVFGAIEANLDAALELVPAECDLAVLPELFATGYQFRNRAEARELAEEVPSGFTTSRLAAFARTSGTTVVAGVAERDADRIYNSAVLVRPDGSVDVYRKVHLFWDEKTIFAPGNLGFPVFPACGTQVGLLICFDWIFPEAARTLALRGATILCHPSNLVLSHCPDAMITRCLENRVFAATANRIGREARTDQELVFIGRSQIVAPWGECLAACGEAEPAAAEAVLDPAACTKTITPRNDLWQDRRPEHYHHD
jgi:predicted amidohydrolase